MQADGRLLCALRIGWWSSSCRRRVHFFRGVGSAAGRRRVSFGAYWPLRGGSSSYRRGVHFSRGVVSAAVRRRVFSVCMSVQEAGMGL